MAREWKVKGGGAKPVVRVAVKGTPQPGLDERKLKGGPAKPVYVVNWGT